MDYYAIFLIKIGEKVAFNGCNIFYNILIYLYRENHIDYG